jgi:hypothetical protein
MWLKKNKQKEYNHILVEGTLLCRLWEDKLSFRGKTYVQVVVPEAMQEYIIQAYHSEEYGGHLGVVKTYVRLRKSFYWVGMYLSVEKFVKSCYICQCCSNTGAGRSASPGNVHARYPMHILAMDILSKLPKSASGATNCIVFVDIFTGFCWAFAMNVTNAQECAKRILKVFAQVGPCNTLRHDRDRRFLSSIVDALRCIWNVHQLATLAYNPTADGHVERKIGVIQLVLRKLVEDALQKDWEDQLDRVCFSLNISYDAERKDTPFYLMHGWDPKNAVEVGLQIMSGNETSDAKIWRERENVEHQKVLLAVKEHYRDVQLKRAKKTEVLQRGKPFKVGDRVWVFDPKYGQDENRKLSTRWNGPFRVKAVRADRPFMYQIEVGDNVTHDWIKFDRLKLCTDPDHKPFLDPINVEVLRMLDEEFEGHEIGFDSEREVEIEEIIGARITRPVKHSHPRYEFEARLKNGEKYWIPYDNLNCDHLVKQYLAKNKLPTLSVVTRRQRISEDRERQRWSNVTLESIAEENEDEDEGDGNLDGDGSLEFDSGADFGADVDVEDDDGVSRVVDAHVDEVGDTTADLGVSSRGRRLKGPRVRLNLAVWKVGVKDWLIGLRDKIIRKRSKKVYKVMKKL